MCELLYIGTKSRRGTAHAIPSANTRVRYARAIASLARSLALRSLKLPCEHSLAVILAAIVQSRGDGAWPHDLLGAEDLLVRAAANEDRDVLYLSKETGASFRLREILAFLRSNFPRKAHELVGPWAAYKVLHPNVRGIVRETKISASPDDEDRAHAPAARRVKETKALARAPKQAGARQRKQKGIGGTRPKSVDSVVSSRPRRPLVKVSHSDFRAAIDMGRAAAAGAALPKRWARGRGPALRPE